MIIMVFLPFGLVFAAELKGTPGSGSLNALDSGYAIARWPLGTSGEVFIGDIVSVRACTTETVATKVMFRWIRPDGSYIDSGPWPLSDSGDTWDGDTISARDDTQTIDMGSVDGKNWVPVNPNALSSIKNE